MIKHKRTTFYRDQFGCVSSERLSVSSKISCSRWSKDYLSTNKNKQKRAIEEERKMELCHKNLYIYDGTRNEPYLADKANSESVI